jgi:hypothetical protein
LHRLLLACEAVLEIEEANADVKCGHKCCEN